ncbi:MAG: GntR family transcriptional regulator [Pseudonocardia sp.]|nr:GntR family transcriptional regulator [Pseudonocardia sp.]
MSKRSEITAAIREGIKAGRWKPGEQLPTVYAVCEEFNVSTSTAVYGMRDLGDLVDPRQGMGYYVTANAPELLQDARPRAVVEAHTALVALRDELDQVIARLAA